MQLNQKMVLAAGLPASAGVQLG